MTFSNYDAGTVLGVLFAALLIMSRNTVLQLLGVAFLIWRFGLGGCEGFPLPGCSAVPQG